MVTAEAREAAAIAALKESVVINPQVGQLLKEQSAELAYAMSLLPEGSPPPAFRFRPIGEIALEPPVELVHGIIEADSFAVAFGAPSSCKTFGAIDLSASIATGRPFQGHSIVRPGLVAYIAGEGQKGLRRRLQAWEIHHGVCLKGAPLVLSPGAATLCEPETFIELERGLAAAVIEFGPPRLIVVDTWSRNLAGDENSSLDSAAGVAALDRLRRPYGCTVLVVHHSGWNGDRTRGSTVLKAAADLELKFERKDDGVIRVEATKIKDYGPEEPMAFRLVDVDLPGCFDDEGRQVHSAVLEQVPYEEPAPAKPLTGKHQTKALEVLGTLQARNCATLAQAGRDPSEAKVTLIDWRTACYAEGIPKNRLSEVLKTLTETQAVIVSGPHLCAAEFRSGSRGISYPLERNGTATERPTGTKRNEPEPKPEREPEQEEGDLEIY